jgi:anti-anti-sigma factor
MTEGSARWAEEGGTWFLKLGGDVRHTLAPAVNGLLDRAFATPGLEGFVVDLSEAEAIDSTCLGVLARIANHLSRAGLPRPTVIAPGQDIRTILAAVCFDRIFDLVAETDPATAPGAAPLAAPLAALAGPPTGERERLALVLEAHRRLCAIDRQNREVFKDLVLLLERELGAR